MERLTGILTPVGTLSGVLSANGTLSGVLTGGLVRPFDYYTGPYEVTPSQETQVLNTASLSMAENVVINPVPSNYGRVAWNGSYLTVS